MKETRISRRTILKTVGVAGAVATAPAVVVADKPIAEAPKTRKILTCQRDCPPPLVCTTREVEAGSEKHHQAIQDGYTCTAQHGGK
jgi:hypothetical protein